MQSFELQSFGFRSITFNMYRKEDLHHEERKVQCQMPPRRETAPKGCPHRRLDSKAFAKHLLPGRKQRGTTKGPRNLEPADASAAAGDEAEDSRQQWVGTACQPRSRTAPGRPSQQVPLPASHNRCSRQIATARPQPAEQA